MDRTLAWTVEEVARNSRPSPIQVQFGGWLINASGGPVRRINATTPTEHRSVAPDILIGAAETIYDALGRAAIFKVLSVADEIDAALAARNYRIEAESLVLLALALPPSHPATGIEITPGQPSEEWLAAWATMDGGASEAAREAFRRSLASIVLPKAFAARRVEGRLASIAYGVLHRGFLGLEAVGTEPQARRQGHARHVLAGLMDWAGGQGGERACLSVLAENAPALALYRSLGFTRDVYRYHYRRND